MKHLFFNDYSEGAHPKILERLAATNLQQMIGYGEDELSLQAAALIKQAIGSADAAVHFVSGGTQANLLCLASMMRPYESVVSAQTGHIHVHEAGAVEATGHKIEAVSSGDGKLSPPMLTELLPLHEDEHTTKPKVVFISNSTEVGTIYSKAELEALSQFCKQNHLYLYLDGARLGSALMAENSDLTLQDISRLTDMFYIGGTKNGALLAEAVVIVNPDLQIEFRRHIKQRGGLLAKGRVLGVQFLELFQDDLYFELARHANQMASKLATGISGMGYKFLTEPTTNQIFPILPNDLIKKLQTDYGFYVWGKHGEASSIRLVTSWATQESAVDEFLLDLKRLA